MLKLNSSHIIPPHRHRTESNDENSLLQLQTKHRYSPQCRLDRAKAQNHYQVADAAQRVVGVGARGHRRGRLREERHIRAHLHRRDTTASEIAPSRSVEGPEEIRTRTS